MRHREASLARVCQSFRSAMKNGGVIAVCAAADLWRFSHFVKMERQRFC